MKFFRDCWMSELRIINACSFPAAQQTLLKNVWQENEVTENEKSQCDV